MVTLYLSDEAYNHITYLARIQDYTYASNYGLGKFINDLSTCRFSDTRPSHIKESDEIMIAAGKKPYWYKYGGNADADPDNENRDSGRGYPRFINISQQAIENYMAIAYQFNIIRKVIMPNALTAAVLEAIGLKWLMPDMLPVRRKKLWKKKLEREFNWGGF